MYQSVGIGQIDWGCAERVLQLYHLVVKVVLNVSEWPAGGDWLASALCEADNSEFGWRCPSRLGISREEEASLST